MAFNHGVLAIAQFEMVGQFATEERSQAKCTSLIFKILGKKLIILFLK